MNLVAPLADSFLLWHRGKEYDSVTGSILQRKGRNQQRYTNTMVVACRYWFELTDGYWGQFTLTQLPHLQPQQILPSNFKHLDSMQNCVGMIEFLSTWSWSEQRGIIRASHDLHFRVESLPLRISKQGDEILQVGTDYVAGQRVFTTDHDAFKYMISLSERDLEYRGFRDDPVSCFTYKQQANFLLYRRVLHCDSNAEYEALRQHLWA